MTGPWTEEEIGRFLKMERTSTDEELSWALKRHRASIRALRRRLKLLRQSGYPREEIPGLLWCYAPNPSSPLPRVRDPDLRPPMPPLSDKSGQV